MREAVDRIHIRALPPAEIGTAQHTEFTVKSWSYLTFVYFERCGKAAIHLIDGRTVSIQLEVLSQFNTDLEQWIKDLSGYIKTEFWDPETETHLREYKVSVLVKGNKAIASAKQVA
jgi:hypothetical protein